MNARRDQRVRAGRGAAVMGVGFEVDVERAAAGFAAGGFESEDFGVLDTSVGIRSRADDVALGVGNDRADIRVGRSESDALARKFKCAAKKFVVGGDGHSKEI